MVFDAGGVTRSGKNAAKRTVPANAFSQRMRLPASSRVPFFTVFRAGRGVGRRPGPKFILVTTYLLSQYQQKICKYLRLFSI